MDDIELIQKRITIEAKHIDILRFKVEALEALLKNHIPNFEEQYAKALFLAERDQKKRKESARERYNG